VTAAVPVEFGLLAPQVPPSFLLFLRQQVSLEVEELLKEFLIFFQNRDPHVFEICHLKQLDVFLGNVDTLFHEVDMALSLVDR